MKAGTVYHFSVSLFHGQRVHSEYPDIETVGLPEAEVFQRYLAHVYGLQADYLETQSTNCGNNITYLLDTIRDKNIPCKSIILTQDATMQMDTVLMGKDFIAHVDIPEAVSEAFEALKKVYGTDTREANPLYASK